jgi:hypothetical protein
MALPLLWGEGEPIAGEWTLYTRAGPVRLLRCGLQGESDCECSQGYCAGAKLFIVAPPLAAHSALAAETVRLQVDFKTSGVL